MNHPPSEVLLTISYSDSATAPPENMIGLLARLLKRPPGDLRVLLETGSVRLKGQVNRDLEKLVAALEKTGFSVRTTPLEGDLSARMRQAGAVAGPALPDPRTGTSAEWKKGDVIEGLYEVLGSSFGGMGNVYFVFHRQWKMMLAIKTPRPDAIKSEAHQLRFLREAELWVDLGLHPNIATCYYVRVINGLPRLFIEYVDGGPLDQWQRRNLLKDMPTILDLMIQFCHGMMFAEQNGMIHRDVKPANCLLSREKILKITDFGLVKRVEEPSDSSRREDSTVQEHSTTTASRLTLMEKGIAGSPWYMAPERFTDRGTEDIRSDIYSFGVMLYEIVLSARPFALVPGFSLPALVRSHLKEKPVDPFAIRSDLPKKLGEVMLTCLEKKPEDRYQSFEDVCVALEAASPAVGHVKKARPRPNLVGLKADSLNNQAVSMLDLGREKDAIQLLENAHSSDTDHLEAVYNLHTLRWARAEISDREVVSRMQSLRIEVRESADYHHLLGLIALQRGDAARAVTLLTRAAERAAHHKERWKAYAGAPQKFVQSLRLAPIGKKGAFAGHVKGVLSMTFSASSQKVFTVGEDRSIRVWDVDTGRCLKNVRPFNFAPLTGAFSPDGRLAATGYGESFKTLDVWDVEGGRLLRRYQGMAVVGVTFSGDSGRLAAFDSDGHIRVLYANSDRTIQELRDPSLRAASIAFCSDGEALLVGGEDGSLALYRLKDTQPAYRSRLHEGPILALDAAPDGDLALTGGRDDTVRLVHLDSGEEVRRFRGHRRKVIGVRFLLGGKYVVSGSSDSAVKIWDSDSGRCYRTIAATEEELEHLAVSADGRLLLAAGARGSVEMWSVDTGWFGGNFLEPAICRPKTFEEVSLVRDSFQAAVDDFNKAWRRGENREALKAFERVRNTTGFCWSKEAILLRNILGAGAKRGPLRSWTFVRSFYGHTAPVAHVQAAEDGLTLLTGSTDGTAALWDVVSGRCVKRIPVNSPVKKVLFMLRGQGFLTWSDDGILRRWDLQGSLIMEVPEVKLPVRLVPSGKALVALSTGNRAVRIELETGRRVWQGPVIQGEEFVCFSGDVDSVFSLRGEQRILRWSAATGLNEGALRDLGLRITSFACSANDDRLIAGTESGEVAVYIVGSGVNVAGLRGHKEPIRVVAPGPAGNLWLTGSDDCSLRLWDTTEERCAAVFEGHSSSVRAACFFSNGSMIGSGAADGSVRLWGLEWEWSAF